MNHRRSLVSASIVVGRLLLATIAAVAAVFGFFYLQPRASLSGANLESYVCPMHPQVTSPAPGSCPICNMALVPKQTAPRAGSNATQAASLELARVPPELRAFDALSRVKRFDTSLEMRAPAWLESRTSGVALFHRDQSRLIEPGEAGQFSAASGGDVPSLTMRASAAPFERWDEATDLVRFELDETADARPNETGWVKFATRLRRDLVIRASAVCESPEGPYVLVASNDRHRLSKRPVEIGSRLYDYAAVLSGLSEGEYVVAKQVFALDAARRLGSESR